MKQLLCLIVVLLSCLPSQLHADEELLDRALEALIESQEPEQTVIEPVDEKPAAVTPQTSNDGNYRPDDIVRISRDDLSAWAQQQKLQANVITNQADNQLWTVMLLSAVWLITFSMLLAFMRRRQCPDYVNAIGLNLIIFATVFMVLVVETDQQLTAGAGILGAIAGYLFRAMQNNETTTETKAESK